MSGSKVTAITASNFNSKAKSWVDSQLRQRDSLQGLIEFGLSFYSEGGDTTYLSKVQQVVCQVKTVPAKTIQEYIMAHANVYLVKDDKTKAPVYRKKKKKGEKVDALVTMPSVPWYDHAVNKKNDVDWDMSSYSKRVYGKITKEGESLSAFIAELQAIERKSSGPSTPAQSSAIKIPLSKATKAA